MSGVTLCAANIVSPMISASEVVVVLFSGMTAQAGFGCRLCIHPFERNYLRYITGAFDVSLAGSVTGFAADDLAFP